MPPEETKKAKATREEGIVYISSFGASSPSTDAVDAEKLYDYQDNVWVRGLARKQNALLFTEKYTIEILDANGEKDASLGKRIMTMLENVRLWANIQLGYKNGIFLYGCAIYNPIWGYEGSEYVLQDLRYLPAYTFREPGGNQQDIYSDILQGITLDKQELVFWQTDGSNETRKLNTANLFLVKDPSSAALAGESIILPLIPFLEMLKFSWSALMQYMNRVGAPIIFIKITEPLTSAQRNGDLGDIEYGQQFLQQWGKDVSFLLRDNMELIELNIKDANNNLEVIDALNYILIDYMTPSSFISRAGGTSLGESDSHREEFFYKYIQGQHTWLEDQFERLIQTYLDKNGYKDYIANMHIPSPSIDKNVDLLIFALSET